MHVHRKPRTGTVIHGGWSTFYGFPRFRYRRRERPKYRTRARIMRPGRRRGRTWSKHGRARVRVLIHIRERGGFTFGRAVVRLPRRLAPM